MHVRVSCMCMHMAHALMYACLIHSHSWSDLEVQYFCPDHDVTSVLPGEGYMMAAMRCQEGTLARPYLWFLSLKIMD